MNDLKEARIKYIRVKAKQVLINGECLILSMIESIENDSTLINKQQYKRMISSFKNFINNEVSNCKKFLRDVEQKDVKLIAKNMINIANKAYDLQLQYLPVNYNRSSNLHGYDELYTVVHMSIENFFINICDYLYDFHQIRNYFFQDIFEKNKNGLCDIDLDFFDLGLTIINKDIDNPVVVNQTCGFVDLNSKKIIQKGKISVNGINRFCFKKTTAEDKADKELV